VRGMGVWVVLVLVFGFGLGWVGGGWHGLTG